MGSSPGLYRSFQQVFLATHDKMQSQTSESDAPGRAWHLGGPSVTPCSFLASSRRRDTSCLLSLCLLWPSWFPWLPSHGRRLQEPLEPYRPLPRLIPSCRFVRSPPWPALAAWHGWTGRCPCSARLSSSPPTHGCVGSASSLASIDLPIGPAPLFVQLLHRRPRLLRSYGPRQLLLSGRTSSSPWPGFAVVRAGVASLVVTRTGVEPNSAQLLLLLLLPHIVPSLCAIILFMDHPCDLYLYGCSRRSPAPLANPLCPCPSIPPTAHNRSGSVSSGSPS